MSFTLQCNETFIQVTLLSLLIDCCAINCHRTFMSYFRMLEFSWILCLYFKQLMCYQNVQLLKQYLKLWYVESLVVCIYIYILYAVTTAVKKIDSDYSNYVVLKLLCSSQLVCLCLFTKSRRSSINNI